MGTTDRRRLNLWVRLDGNGDVIPGSEQYRPIGVRPRDGRWKQVTGSYCCNPGTTLITFHNTTASANITAIETADGAINWTGSLANGKYYSFVIPNGYDETFNITVNTPTGRTITTSVAQQDQEGTATISAVGSITLATNSFSTNVAQGAQFLVVLS